MKAKQLPYIASNNFVCLNKAVFQKVPEKNIVELGFCHMLTQNHLDCMGQRCQNVPLSVQFWSHSTSRAVEYVNLECKPQAKAIKIVNWIDVTNSCRKYNKNKDS